VANRTAITRMSLMLVSRLALDLELLDAAAPIGLRHVDPAFGVHCDRMAVSELPSVSNLMIDGAEVEVSFSSSVISRRLTNSEDIDGRKPRLGGQAVPQVDGEANIAGPQ
jgi:hypothetical protein